MEQLELTSLAYLMFLAALSGLSIRIAFGIVGQKWATTYFNTMTYLLLPVIGFAITIAISGNIALSLGMVGALSIVRFRHPVKSPLELVIFFLLLTVGIVLSVNSLLAIVLVGYSIALVFAVEFYKKIKAIRGKTGFSISFTEGDSRHLYSVTTKHPVKLIESSPYLIQKSVDFVNNIFTYRLASTERTELENLASQVENNLNDLLNSELRIEPR